MQLDLYQLSELIYFPIASWYIFAYNQTMAKKVRWVILAVLLVLGGAFGWRLSYAQTPGQKYFPETGHWVTSDFLVFYQRAADPLLVYGFPITESFQDQTSKRIVQYFQRARFEWHPEEPPEKRVQLSPLGFYLHTKPNPVRYVENSPSCRVIPESGGFQVCYAFLDFFDKNGGVAQFGLPISNYEYQDERIVQYFQRARFEWHPDLPIGKRVVLTDVGRLFFSQRGESVMRLLPPDFDEIGSFLYPTILSLRVRAFPYRAVTSLAGEQTVYVTVRDQNLYPVAGAQAILVFRTPSGEEGRYILPLTDEHGITLYTFPFESRQRGIVKIWVTVSYDNLHQQTTTSYRTWW